MRKDHRLGTILAFTAGAAVGALVGLLAAPKSGEDLRDDVVDAVNDGARRVRSAGKQLQRRAQEVVELATEPVRDAFDAGGAAYTKAKNA
jgi:gas vesicle protein